MADGDFTAFSVPVTFPLGSMDGAMMCVNVTVFFDGLVECEEDFTLELALNTDGDSIGLGNNSTEVTLIDSDCKHEYTIFYGIMIN